MKHVYVEQVLDTKFLDTPWTWPFLGNDTYVALVFKISMIAWI